MNKLNIKKFPNSGNDEWAEFVTKGRQGVLSHNYDAVSGPMLLNPNKSGIPPKAGGTQFAIFTDKAARLFNKYRNCS